MCEPSCQCQCIEVCFPYQVEALSSHLLHRALDLLLMGLQLVGGRLLLKKTNPVNFLPSNVHSLSDVMMGIEVSQGRVCNSGGTYEV